MGGPEVGLPRLGIVGTFRWLWRQLTSMRTALVLLMLLALAAVPGSIWPQRSVDPVAVRTFVEENPAISPWLERFGLFEVFSSPWFAAIYLLLMLSLIGCIVPRTRQHWKAMRAQPPPTPRRLSRLPEHRTLSVPTGGRSHDELTEMVATAVRRRRFRVRGAAASRAGEVSGENGYLRETGNLVFHASLLAVIISVAAGHLYGWRGEVILAEGGTFTSTTARYDTLDPGTWVDPDTFTPFVLTLNSFSVTFDTEPGNTFGQPSDFTALVSVADEPGAPVRAEVLRVNSPLNIDGTSVYLLGNGYAPVITVEDADGQVLYSQPTPFLTQDNFYTSSGAIKVSAAEPQLGFHGDFLPTIGPPDAGLVSVYPDLYDPMLVLAGYQGELFPDGRPQSVYTLDVSAMEQLSNDAGSGLGISLRPGETVELPDGLGSITLDGVVRWVGLVMRNDPGRLPVLISSLVMLAGLIAMLIVPRRRVFARVLPVPAVAGADAGTTAEAGHTEIELGAIAKGSDPGLARLLEDLAAQISELSLTADGHDETKDEG